MAKRALQTGGRAKATGGKAATVGCPKCCGDDTACCICVNLDAKQGDPCYKPGYPQYCNPVRECCCGTAVRAVAKEQWEWTYRSDSSDCESYQTTHAMASKEWVFENIQHETQGGKCVTQYRFISFRYKEDVYRNNFYEGKDHFSEDHYENTDDPGAFPDPHSLCRPDVDVLALLAGIPSQYLYADEYPDGTLAKLMKLGYCSGNGTRTNGFGDIVGRSTWGSSFGCRKASSFCNSEYHYDAPPPYCARLHISSQASSSLTVTVIDGQDCCPDDDGRTPFDEGPGEPVDPIDLPGDPGFEPVPSDPFGNPSNPILLVQWAGTWWRGTPAPLRWLTGKRDVPGCGCHHKSKSIWERFVRRLA